MQGGGAAWRRFSYRHFLFPLDIQSAIASVPPTFILIGLLIGYDFEKAIAEGIKSRPDIPDTIANIKMLAPLESGKGVEVDFKGTVAFFNPDSERLWLVDPEGAILVYPDTSTPDLRSGQRVRIQGITRYAASRAVVVAPKITVQGEGVFPVPTPASIPDILSGHYADRWIEVRGVVRSFLQTKFVEIKIHSNGRNLTVYCPRQFASERNLIDCEVQIKGVAANLYDVMGRLNGALLHSPGESMLEIINEGSSMSPVGPPLSLIGAVLAQPIESGSHRVYVVGNVVSQKLGASLVIKDALNEITAYSFGRLVVKPGDRVHVRGFPVLRESAMVLDDAVYETDTAKSGTFGLPSDAPSALNGKLGSGTVFRAIQEIRSLGRAASNNYPVEVKAVVTHYNRSTLDLFVQDATAGIYVYNTGEGFSVASGDAVTIRGVTDPGGFAPVIMATNIVKTGVAALPSPHRYTLNELLTGEYDSQWITISPTLRKFSLEKGILRIEASTRDGPLELWVANYQPSFVPNEWRGLRARITGACASIFNPDRELVGIRVHVPSPSHLELVSVPGDAVLKPIRELFAFDVAGRRLDYARVRGVVTYVGPESLYLQDRDSGLCVLAAKSREYRVGETLEAAGFPVMSDKRGLLEDAILSRAPSPMEQPVPKRLSVEQAAQGGTLDFNAVAAATNNIGKIDGRLIQLDHIRLVEVFDSENETTVTFNSERGGGKRYHASLFSTQTVAKADFIRGSKIRLTGVCIIEANAFNEPNIQLLLRSPADIEVSETPVGLAKEVSLKALLLLAAIVLTPATWVLALRRRVRHQTERIRRELEQKAALQERLRQAQKMEAVGQLAGGIAHDFNNMLTVISGHCILQLDEPALSADTKESLLEIQSAASRAGSLTRQLLTYSRRQQLEIKNISLNRLVEDMAKMLSRLLGEAIELRLELAHEELWICADEGMIQQIVMNLTVNARDAMPDGGQLRIKTESMNFDSASVRDGMELNPGRHVVLTVTDTGCGMDAATQDKIFEPFFTTKDIGKGTGLGLATVNSVVRQHAGRVEVISSPGNGSSFRIVIPAAKSPAAVPILSNLAVKNPGAGLILVVEDEKGVLTFLSKSLQQHGYGVITAQNGPDALSVWAEHIDSIRLVMTDMVMPGGMNGLQLAQRMRQDKPGLKVVYTTGYSAQFAGMELHLTSSDRYIPKPYSTESVLAALQSLLN